MEDDDWDEIGALVSWQLSAGWNGGKKIYPLCPNGCGSDWHGEGHSFCPGSRKRTKEIAVYYNYDTPWVIPAFTWPGGLA